MDLDLHFYHRHDAFRVRSAFEQKMRNLEKQQMQPKSRGDQKSESNSASGVTSRNYVSANVFHRVFTPCTMISMHY